MDTMLIIQLWCGLSLDFDVQQSSLLKPVCWVKHFIFGLFRDCFAKPPGTGNNSKAFKNFFYGGVGGLTGMAVAYPLEYARTRLGSDLGSTRKNTREFSGIWDTLKKAHKAEGIKGIYKGFYCV